MRMRHVGSLAPLGSKFLKSVPNMTKHSQASKFAEAYSLNHHMDNYPPNHMHMRAIKSLENFPTSFALFHMQSF